MKKYKVEIKGQSPIIWNVPSKVMWEELKKCKKNELSEYEENNWKRKAEYDSKGNLIIPSRWIKSSLVDACKKTRMVPNFATRKSETYTYYCQSMMITENGAKIGTDKDLEYYGAFVGAQGAGSKTKTWRVRPLMREWKASYEFVDPSGRMSKEELKELLDYAGLFIGVGDNRVNNFGRFEVSKLEVAK